MQKDCKQEEGEKGMLGSRLVFTKGAPVIGARVAKHNLQGYYCSDCIKNLSMTQHKLKHNPAIMQRTQHFQYPSCHACSIKAQIAQSLVYISPLE